MQHHGDWRVRTAFVVTKAPSEPWALARRTLRAMLAQRFPHPYDVWLCDEDPSAGKALPLGAHLRRPLLERNAAAHSPM